MSDKELPVNAPEEAEKTPLEALLISGSLLLMFVGVLTISVFLGGIEIKSSKLFSMEWVIPGSLFALVFVYYVANFVLSIRIFITSKRGK